MSPRQRLSLHLPSFVISTASQNLPQALRPPSRRASALVLSACCLHNLALRPPAASCRPFSCTSLSSASLFPPQRRLFPSHSLSPFTMSSATPPAGSSAFTDNGSLPSSSSSAPSHSFANDSTSSDAYRGEILCNRAINMSKITAVGFDMDYTLAMYHSEQFETLSATNALHKLVHNLGYPLPLLSLKYDHSKFIRGLVVDKHAGNIIKLDRHKYVKRAVHGDTSLSKDERAAMYDVITHTGGGFSEPRFAVLDAMFALPDAFLFASVVAYKDKHPAEIPQSYETIYKDVRRSVDMCHRDGSIKDRVAEDPARFIQRDARLMPMLRKIRRSGRKVFLLTNSLWNYTDVVMQFLHADGAQQEAHWIDLFDVIITASAKPAFMLNTHLPIFRCDPVSGDLKNTDGVYNETPEQFLARGKCFQGGNYQHLHDLLAVDNGTQVLYVGDHIFSDVLRSKRTLGWRTMLVVPELEHEVNMLYAPDSVALTEEITALMGARDELDEWVDRMQSRVMDLTKNGNGNADEDKQNDSSSRQTLAELKVELDAARTASEEVRGKIVTMVENYHRQFHPLWGQLFKTGLQNSRFAEQVESYACLYTSKVSNIDLISPETHWRAMNDLMPHDRLTVAPMHRVLSRRANMAEEDSALRT